MYLGIQWGLYQGIKLFNRRIPAKEDKTMLMEIPRECKECGYSHECPDYGDPCEYDTFVKQVEKTQDSKDLRTDP